MKILQINKYFYQKGGAETVFLNTIAILQENGHSVVPFSLKNEKNRPSEYSDFFVNYPELSESGILQKIINAPAFIYNRKAAKQLERLILQEKPDIAHIHLMFNSFSVAILPVLRKHKIPIVMSLHDHRLICPAYAFIDGKGNLCERCLKDGHYWHCITNKCSKGNLLNSIMLSMDSYFRKYIINPIEYVDKFIFVGEFARNKHIQFCNDFKYKSLVLHNFTTIKHEYPSSKEDYLLYFGRISEEKGIPILLQAMEELPNITLKIVGKGPLLDKLKERKLPNVEFVGYKSGEELFQYIRKAKFIVTPSICYENNTMVIPESFTLGTPAIASQIGGIPEFIQEGINGFLVKPRSSEDLKKTIVKAFNLSDEEYKTMCLNANEFAKNKFAISTYYKNLMSIYTDVIKKYKV